MLNDRLKYWLTISARCKACIFCGKRDGDRNLPCCSFLRRLLSPKNGLFVCNTFAGGNIWTILERSIYTLSPQSHQPYLITFSVFPFITHASHYHYYISPSSPRHQSRHRYATAACINSRCTKWIDLFIWLSIPIVCKRSSSSCKTCTRGASNCFKNIISLVSLQP
jgi:hypothetical protein